MPITNRENKRSSMKLIIITLCFLFSALVKAESKQMKQWETVMQLARSKAKKKEFSYIIENMLAPEFIAKLKVKYGEKWKTPFTAKQLTSLSYYYGWLKKHTIEKKDNKIIVTGEYGCFAAFQKVEGKWFICDFGQHLTSM